MSNMKSDRVENDKLIVVCDNTDTLRDAFSDVGKGCGFGDVTANFFANGDFSVKWERSYGWARFWVSDYLSEAPKEVLSSLADVIFKRMMNNEASYSDEVKNFVTAPEFARKYQPTYLARHSLSKKTMGKHKDLKDHFDALVGLGLVEKDDDLVLTWTKESERFEVGKSSSLMKVIAINKKLDDDVIPDYVLDFVVFHEYLVSVGGRKRFGTPKSDWDMYEELKSYPYHSDAVKHLTKLGYEL